MSADEFSPQEFGRVFQRFMEWASHSSWEERSPFKGLLSEHFGEDPATFPVTGEAIAEYDLPNLQLALIRTDQQQEQSPARGSHWC